MQQLLCELSKPITHRSAHCRPTDTVPLTGGELAEHVAQELAVAVVVLTAESVGQHAHLGPQLRFLRKLAAPAAAAHKRGVMEVARVSGMRNYLQESWGKHQCPVLSRNGFVTIQRRGR